MEMWHSELKLYDCNILIDAVVETKRIRHVKHVHHARSTNRHHRFQEPTFTELLWESKDPRMRDLAATLEDGQFVTTQLILMMVHTKLVKANGLSSEASREALTKLTTTYTVHWVPNMNTWNQVKAEALGRTADALRQYAPETLADMDERGKANHPDDSNYSNIPRNNLEKIDGEDLAVILAAELAGAVLVTGDRNCGEGNSKLPSITSAREGQPGRETLLYVNPNGGGWRPHHLINGQPVVRKRTIRARPAPAEDSNISRTATC